MHSDEHIFKIKHCMQPEDKTCYILSRQAFIPDYEFSGLVKIRIYVFIRHFFRLSTIKCNRLMATHYG